MSCLKIGLLCSRLRSQSRFKSSWNLYVSYIFCTTDLLEPKVGVLMKHYYYYQTCTTRWTYTDSNTLTFSITRHSVAGEGGILLRKATNLVFVFVVLLTYRHKVICVIDGEFNFCLWLDGFSFALMSLRKSRVCF